MSWLKFLSATYPLPSSITDADIDAILANEQQIQCSRDKYTKPRDIVNFKSALRKYRDFMVSDFRKQQEETILAETKKIENDVAIAKTERIAITRARVGQGLFRERLIEYWQGCSISSFSHFNILTASHIKPWRDSDNQQRLDVYNGLLLLPNFDKLFDKGYISFHDDGKIIYSSYLSKTDRALLGMGDDIHLLKIDPRHKGYLKYHRDNCLMS